MLLQHIPKQGRKVIGRQCEDEKQTRKTSSGLTHDDDDEDKYHCFCKMWITNYDVHRSAMEIYKYLSVNKYAFEKATFVPYAN